MRIAQLLLPGAGYFDRKSQRIDARLLRSEAEVLLWPEKTGEDAVDPDAFEQWIRATQPALLHFYGQPSRSIRKHLKLPWLVNSGDPPKKQWFRRAGGTLSPLLPQGAPEAVEEEYFRDDGAPQHPATPTRLIGTLARGPEVLNACEQAYSRLLRFREDIDWDMAEAPPTLAALRRYAVWVDPTPSENDLDGMTAEALAAGLPVIATRTSINRLRLDEGSGWLVPVADPNELAHVLLNVLFKPEVLRERLPTRTTSARLQPDVRRDPLLRAYRSLLP